MEQRTILELILGVYKLDKKYRQSPIVQSKTHKTIKPKYTKFSLSDDSSQDSIDRSEFLSDDDIGSLLGNLQDIQDYSDSDEGNNLDYVAKATHRFLDKEVSPFKGVDDIGFDEIANSQCIQKHSDNQQYNQQTYATTTKTQILAEQYLNCVETEVSNQFKISSDIRLTPGYCRLKENAIDSMNISNKQVAGKPQCSKPLQRGLRRGGSSSCASTISQSGNSKPYVADRLLNYEMAKSRIPDKSRLMQSQLLMFIQGLNRQFMNTQVDQSKLPSNNTVDIKDTCFSHQSDSNQSLNLFRRISSATESSRSIYGKKTVDKLFEKQLDQLTKVTNVGLIRQKLLNSYVEQIEGALIPYHLYNPQFDNSLQQVMIDYIIQAYSYDFSAVRVQQNNIMIRLTSIVNKLTDDFDLDKEDEDLIEQIQHTIVQIEKRNQELRARTMFCCSRVMQNHSDKFVICANCGRMCNYQKKSIRKDRNEGVQRNTSYHSIRHFDDVFRQLFIQPQEPIDSVTKLQLQEFMERDHKQKVNIEDVRQYLKQLPGGKGSKLNKSDAFIMGILNGETLKISTIEYQFIKNTFQQFIQILYKNAEIRKNTPNCVSFIRKIIDLLYKDLDPLRHKQIVKRLHQQKENTTRKMQKTWQFLLSQFNVVQIKQEFKDMVRTQAISMSQY